MRRSAKSPTSCARSSRRTRSRPSTDGRRRAKGVRRRARPPDGEAGSIYDSFSYAVRHSPFAVRPRETIVSMTDSPFATVERAVAELQQGHFVVVVDDEDRENEGGLVLSNDKATT